MNGWFKIVIEALLCSLTLFVAHAMPLNTKTIEPAMVAKKRWAYPAGFLYYATALLLPIYIVHHIKNDNV